MNRISKQLIKIAREINVVSPTKIVKIQKSKNTSRTDQSRSDIIYGYKFNLETLFKTDFTDVENYNVDSNTLRQELEDLCHDLSNTQAKINDITDYIFEKHHNKHFLTLQQQLTNTIKDKSKDTNIDGAMNASIFKYDDSYCIVGITVGITDDIIEDVKKDIERML